MHINERNALSAWLVQGADATAAACVNAIDLPERGLAALVLIESHPSCSVDWLHRRLGITQSGTVRLLDRLQQSHLISRDHAVGRREVQLAITAIGRRLLAQGLEARAGALNALLAPLTEPEQDQLTKLISKALSGRSRSRGGADVTCRLCDWPGCGDDCPVDASVAAGGDSPGG